MRSSCNERTTVSVSPPEIADTGSGRRWPWSGCATAFSGEWDLMASPRSLRIGLSWPPFGHLGYDRHRHVLRRRLAKHEGAKNLVANDRVELGISGRRRQHNPTDMPGAI